MARWTGTAAAKRRPLAFLHIPKTAGTSLIEMVSRNFDAGEICRITQFDRSPAEIGAEIEAAIRAGKRFICGHFQYESVAHLRHELDVFTMLRHPVDRLLSLYRFWRGQRLAADAPLAAQFVCHIARTVEFEAFLRLEHPLLVSATRDEMCKALTAHASQHLSGRDSAELFHSASQTLSGMPFGIVGNLESSLRMLSRQLRINLLDAPIRNTTERAPPVRVSEHARECVLLRNHGDMMLHDFAAETFARNLQRVEIDALFDELGEDALTPLVAEHDGAFVWRASMSVSGSEWNDRESLPDGSCYRFTSSPETTCYFPNRYGTGQFSIEVEALFFNRVGMVDGRGLMEPASAMAFELEGVPLAAVAVPRGDGGAIFRIDVPDVPTRGPVLALSIRSPYGLSPGLFGSPDTRNLVAAISCIRFAPPVATVHA